MYSTSVIMECGSPEKAIFTFLPGALSLPHYKNRNHHFHSTAYQTNLFKLSTARKVRSIVVTMQRQIEYIWIIIGQMLSSISMMNIPIDDGNTLNISILLQILRGHSHSIKIAETQRFVFGMMTRWSNQSEGILQFPIEDIFGQFDGVANSETARTRCVRVVPYRIGIVEHTEPTAWQRHDGIQSLCEQGSELGWLLSQITSEEIDLSETRRSTMSWSVTFSLISLFLPMTFC